MTVGGGLYAIMNAFLHFSLALVFVFPVVTGIYSGVLGALCLTKGLPLLIKDPSRQTPPFPTAIMQIIAIFTCDPINPILGIAIFALLSDPDVRSEFRM